MPEQLLARRCPLCLWAGDDYKQCPNCGHGTITYEVTLHD